MILARFVPVIRTFCPPVAGAAKMAYGRYLAFDIFGGVFWVGTMTLGSYFLGHLIPNIAQRIHYVIAVVIVLSIMPAVIGILRARRQLRAAELRSARRTRRGIEHPEDRLQSRRLRAQGEEGFRRRG